MKLKTFLRVAKNNKGFKVVAQTKPNYQPIMSSSACNTKPLPTVSFGVILDIPDECFKKAEEVVATIAVPNEGVTINSEILPVEEERWTLKKIN
jgi:hypothetical protein